MCLFVNSDAKYKRAKEDIICYKVGYMLDKQLDIHRAIFVSLCQQYPYFIGKEQYTKLQKYPSEHPLHSPLMCVERGIHTFKIKDECTAYAKNFSSKIWTLSHRTVYIAECIIPKGSLYYEGTFGVDIPYRSYASNKLIINKIIDKYVLGSKQELYTKSN